MAGLFLGALLYLYGRNTGFIGWLLVVPAGILLERYWYRTGHYRRTTAMALTMLSGCLVLAGYVRTGMADRQFHTLDKLFSEGEKFWLDGRIYRVQSKKNDWYCYVDQVKLYDDEKREIALTEAVMPLNHKWLLVISKKQSDKTALACGYHIRASVTYSPYRTLRNEGAFDEKRYYQSLGVEGKGKVTEYTVTEGTGVRDKLLYLLFQGRQAGVRQMERLSQASFAHLYQGILLGEKEEIDDEVLHLYEMSGIAHVLSISGLHVSLLGMAVYRLFRKKSGIIAAAMVSVVMIGGYTVMVGSGFSTRRAFFMFLIAMTGQAVGRSYDLLSAAAFAFILLLLENPYCILHSGLRLSFGAIVGIGWLYPTTEAYLALKTKTAKSLVASLCIDTVTRPVIVNSYHLIPVYAVLTNLIVMLLMGVMIGFGVTGLLLSFVWFEGGRWLFLAGGRILILYEWLCRWVLQGKNAVKVAASLEKAELIRYYGVLFLLWFLVKYGHVFFRRWKESFMKRKPVRVLQFLLLEAVLWILVLHPQAEGLVIKMIDVGQGESVLIKSEGLTVLVDAGSSSEREIEKYTIFPFLKANGVAKIDYLIITHTDSDHLSGAIALMEERIGSVPFVSRLVLPDIGLSGRDDAYDKLEKAAKENHVSVLYGSRGIGVEGRHVRLSFLWPLRGTVGEDLNTLSQVFLLETKDKGHFKMLFTGDLTERGENALMKQEEQNGERVSLTECDVLKTGHHGSATSSSQPFLNRIQPEFAWISCGVNNRYGHPSGETLDRLKTIGTKVYTTAEGGQLSLTYRRGKITMTTFLQ